MVMASQIKRLFHMHNVAISGTGLWVAPGSHQQRRTGRRLQRLRQTLQRGKRGSHRRRRDQRGAGIERRVHREGFRHQAPLCRQQGRRPRPGAHAAAYRAAPGRCAVAAGRNGRGGCAGSACRRRPRGGRCRHGDLRRLEHAAPVSGDGRRDSGCAGCRWLRLRHECRLLVGDLRARTGNQCGQDRRRARRAGGRSGNLLGPPGLAGSRLPLHFRRRVHCVAGRTGGGR